MDEIKRVCIEIRRNAIYESPRKCGGIFIIIIFSLLQTGNREKRVLFFFFFFLFPESQSVISPRSLTSVYVRVIYNWQSIVQW